MSVQPAAVAIPVPDLCRHCREQTARFRRGQDHDDSFCMDLFRRAIVEHNDACWEALYEVFTERVEGWCRQARKDDVSEVEELATQAWSRFWHAFTPDKLEQAEGTGSILKYLKVCAASVAADAARAQAFHQSIDREIEGADGSRVTLSELLPDTSILPADAVGAADAATRLWEAVSACLKNERERVLVYLLIELGLKSREIQARRPDLYPSMKDVYNLTRNVFDRLGRNPVLQRFLMEDG